MSKPKSLTELAMRHKREAYVERACKDPPVLAPMWEREAEKLLTLPDPPDVGAGGEVSASTRRRMARLRPWREGIRGGTRSATRSRRGRPASPRKRVSGARTC